VYGLPFFLISYCAQFTVLPVHAELVEPTRKRMRAVARLSVGLGAVIYLTVGIAGYAMTGDEACDSIFSNLPQTGALVTMGRAGLIFSLGFSYPLLIMPARRAMLDLAVSDPDAKASALAHVGATFLLVGLGLALAVALPNISVVWSLAGSTVTIYVALTLPGMFYVQVRSQDGFGPRKSAAAALVLLSVVVSMVCSVVSVQRAGDAPCAAQRQS
jgi:amino acid permease